MKIKKFICIITAAAGLTGVLSGCDHVQNTADDDKIDIVCTVFAQYDWTKEIVKGADDKINLTLLAGNGTDIHSYQPSAEDMIKIASCDILIYLGGESDSWVGDALKNSVNRNMKVINMLDAIGDDKKSEEPHDGHKIEFDEHVWLSLDNAEEICEDVTDALKEIMPEERALFEKNVGEYTDKLERLDDEFEAVVGASKYKTLVFADRFPFRYFTDDYDIKYYAAFEGCSAESEASFDTIKQLAQRVNAEGLPAVVITDNTNRELAETVIANTEKKNQKIISFNSMQSVTRKDIDNGISYLSIMGENLEALKQALN